MGYKWQWDTQLNFRFNSKVLVRWLRKRKGGAKRLKRIVRHLWYMKWQLEDLTKESMLSEYSHWETVD